MASSIFNQFPSLPSPGAVTVCENNGRFVYAAEDDERINRDMQNIAPSDIEIDPPLHSRDLSTSFTLPFTNKSAFCPAANHPLKNAWLIWRDKGTLQLLESLKEDSDESSAPSSRINEIVSCMLKCFKHCHSIYCTITLQPSQFDHLDICNGFAPVVNWADSIIRAISVHPNLPLIAISRNDDVIELRDIAENSNRDYVLLKDRAQVAVSCLEWASHSNTLLAVGVVGGVVLWYIDVSHRNIRHPCTFLPSFDSSPVVSISWCPKGRLLACATPTDSTLLIWDVPLMSSTKLKRAHGGGVSLLNWSPDGVWLFAGHTHSLCRVWETNNWTCEKWTNLAGRCKASCWSPNGQYLLFAMEGDPSLYYMTFKNRQMTLGGNGVSAAVKCADLSECCLGDDETDPDSWVGGHVTSMTWDSSGQRLAILLTSTNASGGGNRVAVFFTQCHPVLEIFPGGFVQGRDGECPVWAEFANCFTDPILLVTGWDSGRVSFTPMSFSTTTLAGGRIATPHVNKLAPMSLATPTSFGTPSSSAPPVESLYTKLL